MKTTAVTVQIAGPDRRPKPGSLSFRAGTYTSFLDEMLEAAPMMQVWTSAPGGEDVEAEPLAGMTRSAAGNWVVGLMRAWAVVGDVLTFYQERIANEGYMPTALQHLSVWHLAESLGYDRRPSVAAGTLVSFALLDAKGSPTTVRLAKGLRIQSLPPAGQQPQTWETSDAIVARVKWSQMAPLLRTRPQAVWSCAEALQVSGIKTGLAPGGLVLITGRLRREWTFVRSLTKVTPKPATGSTPALTEIEWEGALDEVSPPEELKTPAVFKFNVRASLYGATARKWSSLPDTTKREYEPLTGGVEVLAAGAASARSINAGLPNQPVRALAVDGGGAFYAAISGAAVYKTTDGGQTWDEIRGSVPPTRRSLRRLIAWLFERPLFHPAPKVLAQLPKTTVRSLVVGAEANLFAGTDNGVFRTADTGQGWQAIGENLPGGSAKTGQTNVPVRALATGAGKDLYAGTSGHGVLVAHHPLEDKPEWKAVGDLGGAVVNDLLAIDGGGLLAATDQGLRLHPPEDHQLRDWIAVGPADVEAHCLVEAAGDASVPADRIYAGTAAGLLVSTDRGSSWRPIELETGFPSSPPSSPPTSPPSPPSAPSSVAALAAAPAGALLAATPFSAFGSEWPGFYIRDEASPSPPASPGLPVYEVDLDRLYAGITSGTWMVLAQSLEDGASRRAVGRVREVQTVHRTDFGLDATVTRLLVDCPFPLEIFGLRNTRAYAASEELALAPGAPYVAMPAGASKVWLAEPLDEHPPDGRKVIVIGQTPEGESRHQVFECSPSRPDERSPHASPPGPPLEIEDPLWLLSLRSAPGDPSVGELLTSLEPTSIQIFANVVEATQGATVPSEVLGNGNASVSRQTFTLRKNPLTYVRAEGDGAPESTLEVRVDGVRWHEAPNPLDVGPADRVYFTHRRHDGATDVMFGDGKHGARVPDGVDNVRASYRAGVWPLPVGKSRLKVLQTKPAGVRTVDNPLSETTPAAPAEPAASARRRAPLSVRTLDRVVSFQDCRDFALLYPGVGKATAAVVWVGTTEFVHVTIVPEPGQDGTSLAAALQTEMRAAGTPGLRIEVAEYVEGAVRVAADLEAGPGYDPAELRRRARAALEHEFQTAAADFLEVLPASRVTELLREVEGVAKAQLTCFDRLAATSEVSGGLVRERLEAAPARWLLRDGTIRSAELLVVRADGIFLTVKT